MLLLSHFIGQRKSIAKTGVKGAGMYNCFVGKNFQFTWLKLKSIG